MDEPNVVGSIQPTDEEQAALAEHAAVQQQVAALAETPDPVAVLEEMKRIPVPALEPPVPAWVQYGLWPIARVVRRFHRWTQAQDNKVKLAICGWLGIKDGFVQSHLMMQGQRRDLDTIAKTVGDLAPEFNKNQAIVADLRLINHTALLRLQNSRKRDKEPVK
jgi:hypothetical protein